ncbi:MAG: transporter [Deltaproteobacteria bacterium]|nr:transporter [Deltaproteobacteria bacterium]
MKRKALMGAIAAAGLLASVGGAWASPGLMELAVRSGFWSNQFPDTTIMLQHLYYNQYDKAWDDGGDKQDTGIGKVKVTANFTRLIRPWHFGDQKQYQFILEAILPFANASWDGDTGVDAGFQSGMMDPMLYLAQGWNNADKTTHVQAALVVRFPFGNDTDRGLGVPLLATDAYAFQPILAIQQHFGSMFSVDGSLSYQIETKQLNGSENKGKNYFELNLIPSVNLGSGWDVFVQYDYVNYQKSQTGGEDNDDAGYNHCVALGVDNWFRPNMQLGLKFEQDVKGKNTAKSQGFNLRYLWIF